MTGNATFEEITRAHRAKLNVVVCGRALINVAREMERRYGIPYVEVSFFGKAEFSKALRTIAAALEKQGADVADRTEVLIEIKERKLAERLKSFESLRGKKAVLYSGGVKSWSLISALMDLGITGRGRRDEEEHCRRRGKNAGDYGPGRAALREHDAR